MNKFFAYIDEKAEEAISAIEGVIVKDVDPALRAFIEQFSSDFGKAALIAAETLAQPILDGQPGADIVSQAKILVENLSHKGLTMAEHDAAQIALNALRVHLTAASQPGA